MKTLLTAALVAVLALSLLTACGANAGGGSNGGDGTNLPENISTPADLGSNDNTSGGNDNNDSNGENNDSGDSATGYPSSWNDEIPKMNGHVTSNFTSGRNDLTVFVYVKNEDVINAYIDSLINQGYEQTTDYRDDNHCNVGLHNGTWAIVIDYGISGDTLEVQLGYSPYVG